MILWAVVCAAIVGILILVMPGSVIRRKKYALDDRQRFEAHLLAGDVVEIGKYLVLYEKVIFKKDPLSLNSAGSGGAATRGECLRRLWGQHFGSYDDASANLLDACGSIGVNGTYLGTNKASCGGAGILGPGLNDTFCPQYIRSALMSGDMIEHMLFDRWVERGVLSAQKPGVYRLELDLTSAFNPANQANLSIPLYFGQRLIDENFGFFLGKVGLKAILQVDYFTDQSSFVSNGAERYIKITGRVSFAGARGVEHVVERSETMMMTLSTPKDFALFIPYPDKGDTSPVLDSSGNLKDTVGSTPATKIEEALDLGDGVEVHGRVYYNGNVDRPLAELPTFFEAVALSGNVVSGGNTPGPADLPLLRTKFKKGLVANLSGPRFIQDGHCAPNGPPAANASTYIKVSNGSRLFCRDESKPLAQNAPFGIVEYIRKFQGHQCFDIKLDASGSTGVPSDPRGATQAVMNIPDGCVNALTQSNGIRFLGRGFREIAASGGTAGTYIISPVKKLVVTSGDVYGTILGGHVSAHGTTRFFSMAALTVGLPGIGTDSALTSFNSAAAVSYEGVSVPMLNLPVVMGTGDEWE